VSLPLIQGEFRRCSPMVRSSARLINVLEIYEQPYSPQQPVVCLDEKPVTFMPMCVLFQRPSRGAKPGSTANTSAVAPPSVLRGGTQGGAALHFS
jgi:hypothetical protein